MASPSLQPHTHVSTSHLRLPQVILGLFSLAFLGLFFYFTFPFRDANEIAAGAALLLLPSCAYGSALFVLFRNNVAPAELDRRWAKWLLRIGLLAGGIGLFALGLNLVKNRNNVIIMFAAFSPAVALLGVFDGVVLRRYFGPVSPADIVPNPQESRVLRVIAWPARRLADFLRPVRSLSAGGALVLASLLLVTSGNFGCSDRYYRGYEIISGNAGWLTAEHTGRFATRVINPAGRVTYAAALICAALALVSVVRATVKKSKVRLAKEFMTTAGIAAVFSFSDLSMFFCHVDRSVPWVSVMLWFSYWVLPLATYSVYGRSRNPRWREHWPIVRMFLAVFYFPLLMFSWFMLLFPISLGVYGYAAYFAGIQLLWFGAIQASVADPVTDVRPSSSSAAAGSS